MPEARKNTTKTENTPPVKAAPVKAAPAKFNFAALTPVVTEAPSRNGGGLSPKDNPAVGWLTESWDERSQLTPARTVDDKPVAATYRGKGRAVTVPADQEKEVYRLVRLAADHLKLGASVDTVDPDTKTVLDKDDKRPAMVTVRFAAKTRKAQYTRAKKATTTPSN
jgi:hypothetical protein